ncbi:MAG: type II toxin-antitoxin system RelE/ParE family toxin [Thiobacillus sp.]|nr:type II toxin-antitoxin system RelE/ParE family toxin [Thiobacillus sp.]
MNTFLRSEEFDTRLSALKNKLGRTRIIHRIRSAEHGNFGDCEPVGEGVSEMRIHFGPGYRVYYSRRGEVIICFCWVATSARRSATSNTPPKWGAH